MAFQWCEGWDAYSSFTDVRNSGKYPVLHYYSQTPSFSLTGGKFGGSCLTSNYAYSVRCPVSMTTGSTLYVAGWWSMSYVAGKAFLGAPFEMVGVSTSSTSDGLALLSNNGSYLTLVNNTSTPLAIGPTFMNDGGFHWVEASFLLSGASSQVTAYVDGILQFSGTYNLSNFPGTSPLLYVYIGSTIGTVLLDDFIIWDNTGTTFNTFPIGARRIGLMSPNGVGAVTQFTPSTGANWQCVSQPFNGTAYVADEGTGNTDLYSMSALPYTPRSNINAVVVNSRAINPAADGTHSIVNKLQSGATVSSGTSRVLTGTNTVYQDAFTLDSSGNPWTLSSVNSAQAGIGD